MWIKRLRKNKAAAEHFSIALAAAIKNTSRRWPESEQRRALDLANCDERTRSLWVRKR